jgi:hypothetical protein
MELENIWIVGFAHAVQDLLLVDKFKDMRRFE